VPAEHLDAGLTSAYGRRLRDAVLA
jgi:hypothetical protein